MYEVALTVAACLRSGTRADVAWLVGADGLEVDDWGDAEVLTPGGGRIGSILNGALDGVLVDHAGVASAGRLLDVEVTEVDALIAGLPGGGRADAMLVPAEQFPADLWDRLTEHVPVCLVASLDGDEVTAISLFTADDVESAGDLAHRRFAAGESGSVRSGNELVSVFHPVPRLVVVGDNPAVRALPAVASAVGWKCQVAAGAAATGLIATLSPLDSVVVATHDLEAAGGALLAALDSGAGYIGSVGSSRMQENRADWLAYRGVSDLSRLHGPAGLDIGAAGPGEIAVAILAEAIAARQV